MKELIIALLLFALLFAGIFLNARFVTGVSEQLHSFSDQLVNDVDPGRVLRDLSFYWDRVSFFLEWTVSKRDLDRIRESILSLESAYAHQDRYAFSRNRALLNEAACDLAKSEKISCFYCSHDAKAGSNSTD